MKLLSVFVSLAFIAVASAQVKYVHLAMTGNATEMVAGWYTDHHANTQVKWGSSSKNYPSSTVGQSKEWKSGYGFNHFAKMTGLNPGQKYYYVCGDSQTGVWSTEKSFTAALPEGSTNSFKMAIYGDMGTENSQKTIDRLVEKYNAKEYDWVFHVGDISYADKHYFKFQEAWNNWFQMIEPVSSTVPYMVCPGNHEYAAYSQLFFDTKDYVVYNSRFLMPGSQSSKSQNMFYSFDYGLVHFISYSSETSYPGSPHSKDFSNQVAWMEADLKKANLPENRKKRPWIFALGHRPIYSSCHGYSDTNGIPTNEYCVAMQKAFEPLFNKYKVDVVFNGHVHSYERNYPTFKNQRTSTSYVNPPNTFNIVTGAAGSLEGLKNEGDHGWIQPQPSWSAHRFGKDYGYGILTVNNGTDLDWKFYRVEDNGVEDQIHIHKSQ